MMSCRWFIGVNPLEAFLESWAVKGVILLAYVASLVSKSHHVAGNVIALP